MSVSRIGVQQIRPQSSAHWQRANPVPERNDDSHDGHAPDKDDGEPKEQDTGRIVDKMA